MNAQKAIECLKLITENEAYSDHFQDVCKLAITALEKLAAQNMERSTAYYNGGWISCSERLPEENEKSENYPTMFVTTKSGEVKLGFYRCTDKEWYIYNEQIEEWDYVPSGRVVAWYLQPEPYKGE